MRSVGERLREERQRLGLSQTELGEIGGVLKQAQLKYEKDERQPDAAYLGAVAVAGVDVLYVLTGQRAGAAAAPLNPEEAALLDNFRHCPPEARAAIKATSDLLAQPKAGGKRKAG